MNLHRAVFTDKNILVQKHQQHGHSYGLVAVHLKLIRHYADFRLLMMQLPLIAVEGKVHQIVGCGGTECILYIAKGRLAVPQPSRQAGPVGAAHPAVVIPLCRRDFAAARASLGVLSTEIERPGPPFALSNSDISPDGGQKRSTLSSIESPRPERKQRRFPFPDPATFCNGRPHNSPPCPGSAPEKRTDAAFPRPDSIQILLKGNITLA